MTDPNRILPDPNDPSEQFDVGPYEVPYTPQAPGREILPNWDAMSKGRRIPAVDPHPLDVDARITDMDDQLRFDAVANNIKRHLSDTGTGRSQKR